MTRRKAAKAAPRTPVDPERLRARFPDLTADDLAAYLEVTGHVLADPDARDLPHRLLALAPAAERRAPDDRTREDRLALRYRDAMRKMQASTLGH